MPLGLDQPLWLLLLPAALLPWLGSPARPLGHPYLAMLPPDALSDLADRLLRSVASVAILCMAFALAGLHLGEQVKTRVGEGAHLVLLLDRSSSMDADFAGRNPEGGQDSKGATARKLLRRFVDRRRNDLVGVVSFSTSALHVLPLTDHREAVSAAIDTLDTPGLSLTNVAKGLHMALDHFGSEARTASRAILLVSDGAALIDARSQELLRRRFSEREANLYWLFLHTAGDQGPFDEPETARDDNARAMPERYLHRFFSTLDVGYRVFDAASAEEVERALTVIEKVESRKLLIEERSPRVDLTPPCIALALLAVAVLAAARIAEVPAWAD
jgi:mxaC protein